MLIKIRDKRDVSPTEKLVLFVLASHLPSIFPSQQLLADETGLARESVNRVIKRLAERGLVKIEARAGGNSHYHLSLEGVTQDHTGCDARSQEVCATITPGVTHDHTKKQLKKQLKKEATKPAPSPRKSTRKYLIPQDWQPTVAGKNYAAEKGASDAEIINAIGEFRAYWLDTSQHRDEAGWSRCWRNNVEKLAGFGKWGRGGNGGGHRKPTGSLVDTALEFLAELEDDGGIREGRGAHQLH